MITPESLLAFASRLSSDPSEEATRTVISRAYYAAFHHLRDIAEDRVGLPRFGTVDDHRDVDVAIRELDPGIANDLARLQSSRNIADYDVMRRVPTWQAQLALDLATRLLAYS